MVAVAALLAHGQCYAACLAEAEGSAETSSNQHHHESSPVDDSGHDGDTGHEDGAGCLQQAFAGPQVSIANVSPVLTDSMMLPAAAHFDVVVVRPQLLSRLETGSPPPSPASAAITTLRI